ncbi:MAG: type I restriction-modification system subunit M [Candidatus Acidiferrales bacterium]
METVKTRPHRRITQAELDAFLEKAADILRGGVDHSEFRAYVFALLFYKRINDVYLENVTALEKELGDPDTARDPRMHDFVVPDECLWEKVARKTERELGTALNDAMRAIERANEPKFDGILANSAVDFNAQDRLPRSKLVAIINHFGSLPLERASVHDDVFGNAYEYLIRNFASKAGKSSGEFYTPREIAYLMSEIVEPQPGHHVGDWAAGSASLLLQCRNYVERHFGAKLTDRLFFYMQEANPSAANIARINMFLHGVRSFQQAPALDSLRTPYFREGQTRRLRQFDRIVMNPPFSLEEWGYDDFKGGDPYDRFVFGLPPRDNGDYAWLQQVVRSLKPTGRAIVVMSQGVLFRGQPEQTEEEDGRNQKADAEYNIREGFVKADLIECVIVLPSKIFYGNTVPGCLVVLNKRKAPERKNKILLIWASRHYESNNPQNLLRRADCMRVLTAWRAYGDLGRCRTLVPEHEKALVADIERDRDAALADIEDAYADMLAPLPALREEVAKREAFSKGEPPESKEGKKKYRDEKKANTDRLKEIKREVKGLEKLESEANEKRAIARQLAEREIARAREAAADLLRICDDPVEAGRYFALVDRPEVEENEFNLNLPRYVDTFDPEERIDIRGALNELTAAEASTQKAVKTLRELLQRNGAR